MTTSPIIFWEDIKTGRVLETGSVTLNAADIRVFAEKFDPQPYHLDREAADASLFGGLCASGWHVSTLR
jgi:acyl dehydratase